MKIFISHDNSDKGKLTKLKKYLECMGFEAFLAHTDIEPGEHDLERIEKELRECNLFIYICNQKSNKSSFCQQEVGFAKGCEKKIIIIITDDNPPQGLITHQQGIKCKNFNKIYSSIYKELPQSKKVKESLSCLKSQGFSTKEKQNYIYLKHNDWNDYGVCTTIDIYIDNEKIGYVKIAFNKQKSSKRHTIDKLPPVFSHFSDKFFSNISFDLDVNDKKKEALKFLLNDLSTFKEKEVKCIYEENSDLLEKSLFRDDDSKFEKLIGHKKKEILRVKI